MDKDNIILGIDIGSVSVSIAGVTIGREIACSGSAFHHGNIEQGLEKALSDIDMKQFSHVAVTSSTPLTIKRSGSYDDQVAIIKAARFFNHKVGSILHVGGEKFSLSLFDEHQNYCGAKNNTSCAAGTGSFLDRSAINAPGSFQPTRFKPGCL